MLRCAFQTCTTTRWHLSVVSDLGKRRDETCDANQPGIRKQFGHLSNAADVFLAVFGGEAQILVKAMANVVAV